ncbi:MAG: MarC family protein [Pyrobaculum sp.]
MSDILVSIVVLYVVVDPVGNIPLFTAITAKFDSTKRRRVLVLSVIVAASVLVLFAAVGISFLSYFGVEMADFMVASGLILTTFSLYYLMRPYEQSETSGEIESVAVVPLAVPFLAGPASISYILVISKQLGLVYTLLVIVVVAILTLLTLLASGFLIRVLGIIGIRVIEKIMLILSAAIGISLIRKGIDSWVKEIFS